MGSFTLLAVLGSGSLRCGAALLTAAEQLMGAFGEAFLPSSPTFGSISGAHSASFSCNDACQSVVSWARGQHGSVVSKDV